MKEEVVYGSPSQLENRSIAYIYISAELHASLARRSIADEPILWLVVESDAAGDIARPKFNG